jgi:hypothetical protein
MLANHDFFRNFYRNLRENERERGASQARVLQTTGGWGPPTRGT